MRFKTRFLVVFFRVSLLIMKIFRSHYTDLTCDFYVKDLKNLLSQSGWQSVDRGTLIHVLSFNVKKCSTRLFNFQTFKNSIPNRQYFQDVEALDTAIHSRRS